jgi:hypothetical protein
LGVGTTRLASRRRISQSIAVAIHALKTIITRLSAAAILTFTTTRLASLGARGGHTSTCIALITILARVSTAADLVSTTTRLASSSIALTNDALKAIQTRIIAAASFTIAATRLTSLRTGRRLLPVLLLLLLALALLVLLETKIITKLRKTRNILRTFSSSKLAKFRNILERRTVTPRQAKHALESQRKQA